METVSRTIPGYGVVKFPALMTEEEIDRAIETEIMPQLQSMQSPQAAPAIEPPPTSQSVPSNFAFGLLGGAADIGANILRPVDALVDYATDSDGTNLARKASIRDFFQEHADPESIAYGAGDLTSTMAGTAGAFGRAAQALGRLPAWAQMVGLGAGGGAASGVLHSPDVAQMPGYAAREGATGALLAPALGAAGNVAGKVAGTVGDAVLSRAPWIGREWSEKLALSRVAEAMSRDKVDMRAAGTGLDELGPEGRLVDVGEKSARDLLDVTAVLPGETGAALEAAQAERIAGRAARLDPAVETLSGGAGRASDAFLQWQHQKEAAAGPLYERLQQMAVRPTGELLSILRAARDVGAFGTARDIAAASRRPFTLSDDWVDDALARGVNEPLSMRDLDQVKQGLDQLLTSSRAAKADGTQTPYGRALDGLRRDLLRVLDRATTRSGRSLYAEARNAFAGPSALQDALDAGRRFMQGGDADALGATLRRLSESEREAFRIGAAEALRTKAGAQAGQTELLNLWKNRNLQEKLREVFRSEEEYQRVVKLLDNERRLKQIEGLGKGSQTAGREAAADDMTAAVAEDVMAAGRDATLGNLPGFIMGLRRAGSRIGTPEPVRNKVGEILLSKDRALLDQIASYQEMLRNRRMAQVLAGQAGAAAAPATTNIIGL